MLAVAANINNVVIIKHLIPSRHLKLEDFTVYTIDQLMALIGAAHVQGVGCIV